jgi:hypothetical protein
MIKKNKFIMSGAAILLLSFISNTYAACPPGAYLNPYGVCQCPVGTTQIGTSCVLSGAPFGTSGSKTLQKK